MAIQLAIVEDDERVIDQVCGLLQGSALVRLLGVARNRYQAEKLITGVEADVYLMDLGLPDVDGVDLIEQVKRRSVDTKVLVLSTFADQKHVMRSFRAGADGYLLKDEVDASLLEKVVRTFNGQAPVNPLVSKVMLERMRTLDAKEKPQVNVQKVLEDLQISSKEWSVLKLLIEGMSITGIAERLFISPHTVNQHLRSIYKKMGVTSRAMAVHVAYLHGLMEV